jgi:hypothetical protein
MATVGHEIEGVGFDVGRVHDSPSEVLFRGFCEWLLTGLIGDGLYR